MTDILEKTFKSSPDAFANAVGDETVLLHLKSGVYFGLDPVGTQIWQGLESGERPVDICCRIASDYQVDLGQVEEDARQFLEDLKANEIIVAA